MPIVIRTPVVIARCQNALLKEIVGIQQQLLARTAPLELNLPASVPTSDRISYPCPVGLTRQKYLQALADVFLATAKAMGNKRRGPKKPRERT